MTFAAKGLAALTCGAAAAVLLTACKPGAQQASAQDAPPPLAALPLTGAAAPQSLPGPVAVDLPYARPARIGPALDPGDGYAYLDRAYFLNDAFGEAPPDYAFAYGDEAPWVWETDDGFIRVVEALPYGDRYYYYQPGEDYPFLIRDPDYAYAYADGDLVAVYDSDGALLPAEDLMLHAPIAGRELARAHAMLRRNGGEHQPVPLAAWTSRRGQVASELGQWQRQEDHQTAWRRYHEAHLRQEQAHWAPERFRREAEAARVLQQVHDPDGAQHAWRQARRAEDVARKAHVRIALAPRGRPGGQAAPQARMAMNGARAPGPGREAAIGRGAPARAAAPDRNRPERFAMALGGPEPRAQYNARVHERGFERPAGPHMRAAEQARAAREARPAAEAHGFRAGGGQASGRPSSQHLHIVMAQRGPAPHGGGHANFGGGHPGGGHQGGGGGHPNLGGGHPGGGGGHPGGGGGHGSRQQPNGHSR